MNKPFFSILDAAGWYENRSRNMDYELELLHRHGFASPNERIIELLKEFGNLRIEFTRLDGVFSDIRLNVEVAVGSYDDEANRIYERIVKETLIPVGVMHFEAALILVSLDFNFYMIYDGEIYKVAGASFENFLDTVINKNDIYRFSYPG
jgi:hypothetical protein